MLYAIFENGGKQYKAVEGAFVDLDLLPDEVGQKKILDKVLLLAGDDFLEVGSPLLPEVRVETTIVEHFRRPKTIVFKYRPKQRYRVKTGHRQHYTRVIVDSIIFPGKKEVPDQSIREKTRGEKKSQVESVGVAKKTAENTNAEPQKIIKSPEKTAKKSASLSIEKLDLSTRATSALVEAGIKTIAQVAKKLEAGDDKLLEVPGIGAKTVEDIKKKLKKLGYK